MSRQKIKIPQYLVRGKHRDFQVLRFPELTYGWAYWDCDFGRYEIDGDYEAFQWLKYAMAALIASPDKILYFPIRKKNAGSYYCENYDAVLTRPELQFRRSEWISLRRQLDPAHQISQYQLLYEPDRLCRAMEGFQNSSHYFHMLHRLKQEVNTLVGDTVFLTMLRENCYLTHLDICKWVDLLDGGDTGYAIGGLFMRPIGWYLPPAAIQEIATQQGPPDIKPSK